MEGRTSPCRSPATPETIPPVAVCNQNQTTQKGPKGPTSRQREKPAQQACCNSRHCVFLLLSSFQLSAKQPGIGPFGCSSFISLLELESPYSGSPISFSIALPIAIAIAVAVFRLLQVVYLIFAITAFMSRLAILSSLYTNLAVAADPLSIRLQ